MGTLLNSTHRESKFNKVFVTVCLLIVLFLSYFDSYGIDGIVPLVQQHFLIEDAQTAIIRTSTATIHTVSLALIWIFGDAFDRRKFFIVSTIAWIGLSLLSVTLGANSFTAFVVFRSVGAGFASVFGVLAPVMLADMFQDRSLGVALMIMTACEALSSMITDILSSIIVSSALPWQTGLLVGPLSSIVPLLGLICTKNRSQRAVVTDHHNILSRIRSSAFGLFSIKSFVAMSTIISLGMFYGKATMFWAPSYVLSAFDAFPDSFHGLSYTTVTTLKSLASLAGILIGLPSLLWLAQSWRHGTGPFSGKREYVRAYPIVVCTGTFVHAAMLFVDVIMLPKNYFISVLAVFISGFGIAATLSLQQQIILMIVPSSSRAAAVALSRLLSGIVSTPSAQLIGVLTDAIRGDSTLPYDRFHAYQMGMLCASLTMVIGAFLNLAVVRFFPSDCKAAEEKNKEAEEEVNEKSHLIGTLKSRSQSIIDSLVGNTALES